MRILIADDHAVVRHGLKHILAEAFKRAFFGEAANAQQTLERVWKEPWDIVILDLTMPGRNGLEVLKEIKQAAIPVILTDRKVDVSDPSLYATFIGADFVDEGKRAADWLAKATGGKATIAQLEGSPGAAPAIDRKKGFEEALKQYPDMKIVKSQSGEFTRAKGREVMETFLKSPEGKQINALYAHNDDMALGAIQAIQEAGLKPGVDIKIVSIDGVKGAFVAMVAGSLNCTVECSPLLGPQLFDAAQALAAKKPVEKRIVTSTGVFEQKTAAEDIKTRKY